MHAKPRRFRATGSTGGLVLKNPPGNKLLEHGNRVVDGIVREDAVQVHEVDVCRAGEAPHSGARSGSGKLSKQTRIVQREH